MTDNKPKSARTLELDARYLLANQPEIAKALANKEWCRLLNLAQFMEQDAPQDLIGTDQALYRTLRAQITEARLRWSFNIEKLQELSENIIYAEKRTSKGNHPHGSPTSGKNNLD